MSRPLVSICVPTCNRALLLRESLRTICAQDYEPLEILISDDASSDETESLCRSLAQQDGRIRYIRQPTRLGLYPNHNFCINESRGDFFCLLHDDDQHHPQLVSDSVAFLLRHPEVGIVCSDWDLLNDAGEVIGVRDHDVPDVVPGLDYISRTIRSGQSWIGCPGAIIRRATLGSARFREDGPIGFADFVVWFQIAERASIGHIARRLWRYRLHRQSLSRRTIESLTKDYDINMNQYCDAHLVRWPEHRDLVHGWRKDIHRYLFWALAYELGLHFRRMREGTGGAATNRSVFEITDYALTDEEVRSVRAQLRKYRTGPAQVVVFGLLEALQNLRLTQPLAWVTQHAGSVRSVLGLK
jgi:glycosyltransferase involved in cell wall biosynthesis